VTEKTQGKGRPTPKRSDAQKRRGGPVAPPPTNRREAAQQLRAKQAENRQRIRKGTAEGDERAMLPRDAGPVRRLVRDLVDARRNMGWLLLPVAAFAIIANTIKDPAVVQVSFALWTATLLGVAMDLVLLNRLLKARLVAEFPLEAKLGKHLRYGMVRSTTIRRFRMPKPKVQRGQRV
jgi:hypothetical protein